MEKSNRQIEGRKAETQKQRREQRAEPQTEK
jgi:hypothetical protein